MRKDPRFTELMAARPVAFRSKRPTTEYITNIYTSPRNFLRGPCLDSLITPENNRVSKEKR